MLQLLWANSASSQWSNDANGSMANHPDISQTDSLCHTGLTVILASKNSTTGFILLTHNDEGDVVSVLSGHRVLGPTIDCSNVKTHNCFCSHERNTTGVSSMAN